MIYVDFFIYSFAAWTNMICSCKLLSLMGLGEIERFLIPIAFVIITFRYRWFYDIFRTIVTLMA